MRSCWELQTHSSLMQSWEEQVKGRRMAKEDVHVLDWGSKSGQKWPSQTAGT